MLALKVVKAEAGRLDLAQGAVDVAPLGGGRCRIVGVLMSAVRQ
jgi:hypothetical protein